MSDDHINFTAAEHMGTDLMGLLIQEFKAMPDVWQKLTKYQQDEVIDRARDKIEDAVQQSVRMIATSGMCRVVGNLEQVSIKNDIKATINVLRNNLPDDMQALFEAHGQEVLIVLASSESLIGGMDEIEGDADQPDLEWFDNEDSAA